MKHHKTTKADEALHLNSVRAHITMALKMEVEMLDQVFGQANESCS